MARQTDPQIFSAYIEFSGTNKRIHHLHPTFGEHIARQAEAGLQQQQYVWKYVEILPVLVGVNERTNG